MKTTQQGIFTSLMVSSGSAVLLVLAAALVLGSNASLRAQTPQLQLVQSNAIPQSGTFYLIQLSNYPPLPFNPYPDLNLYSLTEAPSRYWVDDRCLDYAAAGQQGQMDGALRTLQRRSSLDSDDGPPALPDGWDDSGGDEGTNNSTNGPPVYASSQGLCLLPPLVQSSNVVLTVTNWDAAAPYDLYATTNLSPNVPGLNLTNWAWLGRISPGQTVVTVPLLSDVQCYYRLGTTNDTDGDGLPDAYENLVSHTPPNVYNVVSSDGYGTPDGWYLQQGLNPLAQGIASQDGNQDGLLNWQEYLWGSDPYAPEGFAVWVSSPGGCSGIP
jgi:hypothetical protein